MKLTDLLCVMEKNIMISVHAEENHSPHLKNIYFGRAKGITLHNASVYDVVDVYPDNFPNPPHDDLYGLTIIVKKQDEEEYVPKYSFVVSFGNGDRGYIVSSKDGRIGAWQKLMTHLGDQVKFATSVHIAEILLDEDIVSIKLKSKTATIMESNFMLKRSMILTKKTTPTMIVGTTLISVVVWRIGGLKRKSGKLTVCFRLLLKSMDWRNLYVQEYSQMVKLLIPLCVLVPGCMLLLICRVRHHQKYGLTGKQKSQLEAIITKL